MKLIGLPFLHKTLANIIEEIYLSKKPCEVDPTRLEKTDDIKKNFANLVGCVEEVSSAIIASAPECPQ